MVTAKTPKDSTDGLAVLGSKPSFIEFKDLKFLIVDAPTDSNLHLYIQVFEKKNVVAVVRACEATYKTEPLIQAGIKVLDLPFVDGDPPPQEIIQQWMSLVYSSFGDGNPKQQTIAVHCVAGLGRAPMLVAIALMEHGMENMDVITFIRKRRRGAFNTRQLNFIEKYKPTNSSKKKGCIVC